MSTFLPHIISHHPSTQQGTNYRPTVYLYTLLAYVLLVLLLLLQWSAPPSVTPATEDVIEVNLGNVESASGNEPPLAENASPPEQPTTEEHSLPVQTPPPAKASVAPIEQTPTETVASNDADIASVPPPRQHMSSPKKTPPSPAPKPSKNVESMNIPSPQKATVEKKPIALFAEQEDKNEENASNYDSYGKSKGNQGIGTGQGDMGDINGNISSDNYRSSVVPVAGLGNRKIMINPPLDKDFEHEGIVQIQAIFGRNGQFISARQDIKNSTTSRQQLVSIAMGHVKKIRLNEDQQSAQEQAVTFRFIFKLQL